MGVEFKDFSDNVLSAMQTAKKQTLTAIGLAAIEQTNNYMQSKYGKPIYVTGDLMRDVNSQVREADDRVDVGNSLSYALPVHNGTSRMPARPYLKDAITENGDIWREIAAEMLGEKMK